MNNSLNRAWDTDIEGALLSLTRRQIADHDYWYATVEIVEAGYDPVTKAAITVEALKAWVNRCKNEPQQEIISNASTPRRRITPHRVVSGDVP